MFSANTPRLDECESCQEKTVEHFFWLSDTIFCYMHANLDDGEEVELGPFWVSTILVLALSLTFHNTTRRQHNTSVRWKVENGNSACEKVWHCFIHFQPKHQHHFYMVATSLMTRAGVKAEICEKHGSKLTSSFFFLQQHRAVFYN